MKPKLVLTGRYLPWFWEPNEIVKLQKGKRKEPALAYYGRLYEYRVQYQTEASK